MASDANARRVRGRDWLNIFKLIVLVCYVIGQSAIIYRGWRDRGAVQSYNQGLKLESAGDNAGALAKFNEAIAGESNLSNKADAYLERGIIQQDQGKDAEAMASYNAATKLRPKLWSPYFNRGLLFYSQHNLSRALSEFDQALAVASSDDQKAKSHLRRGFIFHDRKDNAMAMAEYNEATRLSPKMWQPPYNRGLILHGQHNLSGALAELGQALALAPGDEEKATVHLERGQILHGKGDMARAVAEYDQATRLSPKMWEPYFNRGGILLDKPAGPDLNGAMAEFNRGIAQVPGQPLLYSRRAEVYALRHDFARAREDAQKCRALGGTPEPSLQKLLSAAPKS